ncbi:gamma-glutamyltranspeptidase [Glomus cerebriforme]|uniref:Gamma-glutamyltranspeptidase n=1 Tax=Glomus cerebriforme TaxID=658196 RepID=A0A397TDT5_9GLOM|nr:gamma-glutamyltranspeptidase [Glomus cerebriforme]
MTEIEQPFIKFPSRRSVVFGTNAMVACSQPLACQAGLEILKKGGNAADAAVATAAALNVTEPSSTGIGGDCFCLFYEAKTKKIHGMNGSGRSPSNLTLEYVQDKLGITENSIPYTNINSSTIPGAAAGWIDCIEWFGSSKLSFGEILKPAIELAENGYPVSEISAWQWKCGEEILQTASPNGGDMLIDGRAPNAGEIMHMPNLARTFRELVEKGKDGFYKGRIAEAIVELIQSKGGVMTLEDLASHTTTRVEPISIEYKGVKIWECPPNGQGITALIALGILEALQEQKKIPNLNTLEHNSTQYLHVLIESLRLAFADSQYYVTDPDVHHIPINELLSKEYLSKRAQLFDSSKASTDYKNGSPVNSSDTVYFSVVDQEGNACSFIISNYLGGFGTGAIPKDCGFTLHSRGSGFVLEKGHPNCLEPNKRPYHTIIPCMVTKGDELWLSYGVMGGFMQPQGHVQVLLNLLHNNLNPQTSLDAPRICIGPSISSNPSNLSSITSIVFIEEGIDKKVIDELNKMGHNVKLVKDWDRAVFGRGQIIEKRIDEKSGKIVWAGGSDLRGDGMVIGW